MIRLAVFDIAGTTLKDDDGVNRAFRQTLEKHGIFLPKDWINSVMGLRKIDALRELLQRANLSYSEDAIQQMHRDFIELMHDFYRTTPVQAFEETESVFRTLKEQGIQVALNTGFTRSITNILLDRLQWEKNHVIDSTITSDEVPRGRPYPDMIESLRDRLGIANPQEVAKIGDTVVDLQEGTNSGCGLVIGVTTGANSREELLAHPHTHIVGSLGEALGIILKY
jgi:phosphonatase-like hydrolase